MPWWRGRAPHPDLAETIRAGRLALGLTQAQLASRVRCDQSYISRLEAGTRCPSAVEAGRLQAVLGVPIPQPAIARSELSRGSQNRIDKARRQAQQERDAAFVAAHPPAPPVYQGQRVVNGWGRGF